MQAMKGATMALGSMNRQMNLPGLTKIAMEFEKENDVMEQRQEMMDDAIDDAMDVGVEEEGEEVVEQVLEEIGVDLNQAVRFAPAVLRWAACPCSRRGLLTVCSSGRRRRGCRRRRCRRARLRRRLGRTTTCRRAWIVLGGSGPGRLSSAPPPRGNSDGGAPRPRAGQQGIFGIMEADSKTHHTAGLEAHARILRDGRRRDCLWAVQEYGPMG